MPGLVLSKNRLVGVLGLRRLRQALSLSSRLSKAGVTPCYVGPQCRIMPLNQRAREALRTRSARRNLFGPVDHERMRNDLQDLLQDDLTTARRRWGFDFVDDVPVENTDFQWEAVSVSEVPAHYRPSVVGRGATFESGTAMEAAAARVGGSHNASGSSSHTPATCSDATQSVVTLQERTQNHVTKRKQTSITDYYQAKRRAVRTPRKSGQ